MYLISKQKLKCTLSKLRHFNFFFSGVYLCLHMLKSRIVELKVVTVALQKLIRWHHGKESACQCRRCKRCRFDPWVGKIPWSRKCILQYSCLENSTDRGTWQAAVHGVAKSQTQLSTHTQKLREQFLWRRSGSKARTLIGCSSNRWLI